MYGFGGQYLEEIKVLYKEASACMRVDGKLCEGFPISVRFRIDCVMSPWLLNILNGYERN